MIKIGGVGLTGNQHPLMLLGGILIFCLLFVPFAAAQEDTGIAPLNKTQDLTEGNKTCVLSEGSVLVPDPADYADRLNYVPGEVIVEFEENPTVNSAEVSAINSGIDAEVVKTLKGPVLENTQLVKLPEDVSVDEAVSYYSNEPGVIYACPNYLYWLDEVPNDPYFDLQWGLYNNGQTGGTAGADIDALNAWNITKGSEGIVVAVIDSGVKYDHEDLMANIWTNEGEIPDNHIDDDGNGYIDDVHGWDFVNNDNDPMDDNNHGTHCSGIIGAVGNNDAGITGVNWNVKLMPLKAGNALGSLPYIAILEAMDYANSNGADIVSCSFGGDTYTSQQKSMIDASSALYICAAGNSGTDNDYYPHYPSNYDCDNIIAVAATDSDDELADYSCYGVRSVDVAAPGSYIYSTISTTVKFSDDFSSLNSWDAEDPWELTR